MDSILVAVEAGKHVLTIDRSPRPAPLKSTWARMAGVVAEVFLHAS
jgi:hypothetical protein